MITNNTLRIRLKAFLSIAIALIWLIYGFFCKLLNLVPRHQQIVSRILGAEHAEIFTKLIGISETLIFLWIISGIKSRLCAWFQISLIIVMNIIEFILAPDLLLFGKLNIVLASLLVFLIYLNEFVLTKPSVSIPAAPKN